MGIPIIMPIRTIFVTILRYRVIKLVGIMEVYKIKKYKIFINGKNKIKNKR
jgi:hypothetical protein